MGSGHPVLVRSKSGQTWGRRIIRDYLINVETASLVPNTFGLRRVSVLVLSLCLWLTPRMKYGKPAI